MSKTRLSLQYEIIADMVDECSTVLDLGCGGGELLYELSRAKNAKVQGIELDEESIFKCVEKGISVFHGDIEHGLVEFLDDTFDFVILNQSMQEVKNVDYVLQEALRVGKKVIVGFPNFAFIRSRMRLFFKGVVPVTSSLPYRWYDTPNVHFLSIKDFVTYCNEKKVRILQSYNLNKKCEVFVFPNLLASNAIFLLDRSV